MKRTVEHLRSIQTFPALVEYLADELKWPIEETDFEDLTFDYTPEELGLDPATAAKIDAIKQLRPLSDYQPWGIFFVEFEPKRLPVVALRRILGRLAVKKRASANAAERAAWEPDDLMFVSTFGDGDQRQISFAHFSHADSQSELPTLKVLGWDNLDTPLHLDAVADSLGRFLAWPDDETNSEAWRETWTSAFTIRHREVITTARDLSIRLADLARATRDRIKTALSIETETGPLTKLMKAFQAALVHDLNASGFADMYAQTIAYGLLSARIVDPERNAGDDLAAHVRTSPFLRELMATFLHLGGRHGMTGGNGIDFDELGVSEVVELLDDANMEAVVRDFGDRNPREDPVIHFYEHFLSAYDKEQKIKRGVFYTPRPVVSFIVRSVDEALRRDFGLTDGLADTTTWGEMSSRQVGLEIPDGISPDQAFVQILDPATGTGTFLVEVIDRIYRTMAENWAAEARGKDEIRALWNDYVPKHLLPRLHGYELLMAPYAIAHLKIGLKLYETGYQFTSDERVRVYLTNSLEPASDERKQIEFERWIPALAHEARAVDAIKRDQRFTVVIANPPYSGESANKIAEIERSVKEAYQQIDGTPLREKGKKNWLLDDYVKFLRVAHSAICNSGSGVVGYIINNAFQDNPTFRGLRWALCGDFSDIRLLDLHGSGRRDDAGRESEKDENVFDILQGVCVAILSRTAETGKGPQVSRADLWGSREYKYDTMSTRTASDVAWVNVKSKPPQWYFVSVDLTFESEWKESISLVESMPVNGNGLISAKDHFAYAMTPQELQNDLDVFLDPSLSDGDVGQRLRIRSNSMWSLSEGRQRLRREIDQARPCRVSVRPFDNRYSIYHRDVIFNLRRPVTRHIVGGHNLVLLTTRMTKGAEWRHCFVTRQISDCAMLSNQTSTNAFVFPLHQKVDQEGGLFSESAGHKPNFSEPFTRVLQSRLGLGRGGVTPEAVFEYAYAVFNSHGYRSQFSEFLKREFPRLPVTGDLELFRHLAHLGGELIALHLMESPKLKDFITAYTGPMNPEVGRIGWSDGTVWLDASKTNAREGHRATKPGNVGFDGVPEQVWDFHIGGYQVCHKWLKDRKGRTLSAEDLEHYQKIVVALKETIRLMGQVDDVIEEHGGWPGAFALT